MGRRCLLLLLVSILGVESNLFNVGTNPKLVKWFPSPACVNEQGRNGNCTTLQECYPDMQFPHLSGWRQVIIGDWDTCAYITSQGIPFVGTCCVKVVVQDVEDWPLIIPAPPELVVVGPPLIPPRGQGSVIVSPVPSGPVGLPEAPAAERPIPIIGNIISQGHIPIKPAPPRPDPPFQPPLIPVQPIPPPDVPAPATHPPQIKYPVPEFPTQRPIPLTPPTTTTTTEVPLAKEEPEQPASGSDQPPEIPSNITKDEREQPCVKAPVPPQVPRRTTPPPRLVLPPGVATWPPPFITHPPLVDWPPPIPTHPPGFGFPQPGPKPPRPPKPDEDGEEKEEPTPPKPTIPSPALIVTPQPAPPSPPPPKPNPPSPPVVTPAPLPIWPGPTLPPRPEDGDTPGGRKCGVFNNFKVVGGAPAGYWPWIAGILGKRGLFCGGSLIDNYHVLTAAHCVQGISPADVTIRLGDYHLDNTTEMNHINVHASRFTIHPSYNSKTTFNDIAIIRLASKITYSDHILPVCLPTVSTKETFAEQIATVIGWGATRFRGPTSRVLMEGKFRVWSIADCKNRFAFTFPGRIEDTHVCAGQRGQDSCNGDSGGPLMVNLQGSWTQIGVVSWGVGCGSHDYPGVYTRVSSYINWVHNNLN